MKSKVLKLTKDFDDDGETKYDIVADMTRQYKSKQEDLCNKLNKLIERKTDLDEKI